MMSTSGMSYWDAFLPGLILVALAIAILPWLDRNNRFARLGALGLCLLLSWQYMLWRIFYTIPPLTAPTDFVAGLIFTSVETMAMIGSTASLVFLSRIKNRSSEVTKNLPWLAALEKAPKIDVLICTYNEDEEILERTIIGALAVRYPDYRVWVCDDGKRDWLASLCQRHGVGYLTRPDNAHAKAGNINAALAVLGRQTERSEFIAILDADFIPLPEFLTRTVALMRDRDIGVVQTPQHFFNPDPVQTNLGLSRVWPDEQRFFFDIVMASKDAWDAAFCCGTSSLIRHSALISIGGFPTDSVTEDYLVSLRLRQKGFRTVYLNETLSLGLAPEGLAEYSGQRSRWCLGFVQICRGPSGPLRLGNNLPIVDRIMLCETFLYWAATHSFRLLGMIVPVLYLLFDIQAVHANVIDAIVHMFPFFVAQCAIFLWLTEGRVLPILSDLYQVLCATQVLKAVWAGLLRPQGQKFKVTAKGGDRSKRFVQWPMLKIFIALLTFTAVGIAHAFLMNPTRPLAESSSIALFWSWYNIIVLCLAAFVCIEQPRLRKSERFRTNDVVRLRCGDRLFAFQAVDISVSGIHLLGTAPVQIGGQIQIEVGDIVTSARMVRLTERGFALHFRPSLSNRAKLIRHVYSGRCSAAIPAIEPTKVAAAIGARLLR